MVYSKLNSWKIIRKLEKSICVTSNDTIYEQRYLNKCRYLLKLRFKAVININKKRKKRKNFKKPKYYEHVIIVHRKYKYP